jgi:type VI secretion system protein ImpL
LRILWRIWREGRLNARLLGQLRRPEKPQMPEPERNAEIQALSARFDEAINLLRNTRFSAGKQPRLWARFSRQYLYQLPWYIFIGAPGSGKTTALVNAGLQFPLAHRFGKTALRGVGGTRNCDWWFTDDAVLLDTAGRYTTHESDPTGDEEEWKGFLGLLRKYRGRQPINGVMLTISVGDLLSSTDNERLRHAAVLRQRLQELREQLGLRFPVYVLVTKMDLLSGFEEYFAHCSREDLKQVWGFTFPHAQSQSENFNLLAAFSAEYDLLQERLFQGLPDTLAAEQEVRQRALAYLLPQQFEGLRPLLTHFLSDVFASTRFESSLLLRGVYFTSGTQGGQTFDQVAGHLKRYLNIDGIHPTGSVQPHAGDQGRSFFLHDLLKKLIFPEAMLAGRNLKWERRYRVVQWSAYGAISVVLLTLLAGMAISYRNNMAYLAQIQAQTPEVGKLGRETRITQPGDVRSVEPYMTALRELPAAGGLDTESPPWSYRFGLYQGDKVQAGVDGAYRVTQQQVLVPQVARRVEQALRSTPANDLEYEYEALRAYLMMYDSAHYDAQFLHAWVLSDVQKTLPEDYTRRSFDALSGHLRSLMEASALSSPFAQDQSLVSSARADLDSYSLAKRAYSRLRRLLLSDGLPDITFASLGGPAAMTVFARSSGAPLNEGIPALYSYKGYWDVFSPRIAQVAGALRKDDAWILGVRPGREPVPADEVLTREIKRLYLTDYVKYWDGYLNDLRLAPASSLLQSIEIARTLSSSGSPLVTMMRGIAQETTLLRDTGEGERSLLDQARDRVSTTQNTLERMFGPIGRDTAREAGTREKVEYIVDRHFAAYRQLVAKGADGNPPITATTGLIDELYGYLTASDAALRSAGTLPSSPVVTKLQAEAGRLPKPVAAMLTQLSVQASREVLDVERRHIGENVSAQLGSFCRQAIAGRYPFSSRSTRDVAPNDMARLFGPGGMMESFFQANLADHVDMSGRSWRFKPGIDGKQGGMAGYLAAFQHAATIRSVYFTGAGSEPSFKVSIRPLRMDEDITQFIMSVGGQTVRYAHGPQVSTTVQWPGPGGINQASIELLPQTGISGVSASGPWALNRLLDKATLRPGASPEVTLAVFDIGGRQVELEISANSVKNPFRLSDMVGFQCPGKG